MRADVPRAVGKKRSGPLLGEWTRHDAQQVKVCSVRLCVPASELLPPPPTKPPPQAVWSTNRNLLVGLHATVLFSANGDLILLDANGIAVRSTNSSGHGANTLTLTDSGNLLILYPTRSSRHVHRFALIFVPSIHEIRR
ncbi:hypothetical protein KSP40_PGU021310 [Platanthera guangdongensis]|uniref:Bulb-type lectin domain-containing protein n=1 Tax=Platanthera guangdongensis TaxID=2320717 RepID=A0ABR2LX32_9ASPA